MPTVTSMLKTLSKKGLVVYERYEYIELTEQGAAIGREIRKKHDILRKFLSSILRIDDQTAEQDACKMEHDLSSTTLNSLVDFMEFIQTCPRAGENWLEHFNEYRLHGYRPETCSERCKEFSSEIRKHGNSLQDQEPEQGEE
jgi:DtxR family Mn-dependent transcriptional regulator